MTISDVAVREDIIFANDRPFVLVGGMNVLEGKEIAFRVAERFIDASSRYNIPYIFKASFDKANRSSIHSFRGPGLELGLETLAAVKQRFGAPILTDVHEPAQARPAAEVADMLQLPAFLARQTDLVIALAETGKPINVKKPQFLAPAEMKHVVAKLRESGNDRVVLCERGSSFGYNNLVVDMLGMDLMKCMAPVMFDATHALQIPGGQSDSAGGRRAQAAALCRSAIAVGIAGLFLEAHPDPGQAKCDGPSALPLDAIEPFVQQMVRVDEVVKSFRPIRIE